MQDFDFKRCTRKCDTTDREIEPGERYFSAIIDDGEEVIRKDFAEDQWSTPPEGCIGWWQSRVPVLEKGKIYWAPNPVLLAYFDALMSKPDQSNYAYVMALLLIRKRILQWKDSMVRAEVEFMLVRNPKTKETLEVQVTNISPAQIQAIQDELAEQLFTDVIEEPDQEDEHDEDNG